MGFYNCIYSDIYNYVSHNHQLKNVLCFIKNYRYAS